MAETRGLVQSVKIVPDVDLPGRNAGSSVVWAEIGPSYNDTALFTITKLRRDPPEQDAFKTAMVDTLVSARVHSLEVVLEHDDDDARIRSVTLPSL